MFTAASAESSVGDRCCKMAAAATRTLLVSGQPQSLASPKIQC